MSVIRLEDMAFYAYHGCFAEEQAIGTRFRVDLALITDTTKSQQTDNIDDTVSYLDVYRTVKREMMIPSHLLEHVCERIGNAVLKEYPTVESLKIKISKLNPPLGGQLGCASVEIEKSRN